MMNAKVSSYIEGLGSIENLCRVCLTESKKMYKLNSKIEKQLEKDISNIYHVLCRVTCQMIINDDRYPSYICPMCLGLLNICYKFKLQFEKSHKTLTEYFNEDSTETQQQDLDLTSNKEQRYSDPRVSVELISSAGVFDMKDVFIVEQNKEEVPNYAGFLRNLGTEVSATFVNQKTKNIKERPNSINAVSIINLKHIKLKTQNNHGDDEDNIPISKECEEADIDDDMDEKDKNVNSKISKCAVCYKLYANKQYLDRHIKRMHYKKRTFMCELCGASLNSRSNYYYHMKKHAGKTYMCNYCQKMYPAANALQQHIMSRHTNERPHLCTVCGKTFSYSNALIYHMRIHTGERKYRCQFCGRLFRMQCALNRHVRIHTGQRPYACKFCDKTFCSKGEVNCHEMIHTGYRPYHCTYCNKGFTKRYNLKMHLMGHPGNHPCDTCTKTFIEPEYLKLHLKTAHQYVDDVTNDSNKES